jgi:hypothetical protein
MTEQFAQFSSSSFSRPKGIISPHRQSQPEDILVCNTWSQKGQISIGAPRLAAWYAVRADFRYDADHEKQRLPFKIHFSFPDALADIKKSGWVARSMHAARGYYSANPSSARVLLFSPTCFLIS